MSSALTVAVLCRNEAKKLSAVLEDARRAREAGAKVVFAPEPGFGRFVRFATASPAPF